MTIAALFIVTLGSLINTARAQEKPFSISFGGGAGSVPLNDVIRFTDNANEFIADAGRSYNFFNKADVGKFGFVKIAYHINNNWGTSLLFETINITAKGRSTHISFAGIAGTADEEWDFTSFPISVFFEFFFLGRDTRFSPAIGIGPSLNMSRMVRKDVFTSSFTGAISNTKFKDTQIGYGVLLFLEMQSSFYNRFFINSRFQARLAEGMHVIDEQAFNSYDVDFSGVNLTLGFGWRF